MKIISKLLVFFSMFYFMSCASSHSKYKHHHHVEFNEMCANHISKGHFEVNGHKEYSLEHNGEVFYFSSLKDKEEFEKHIEKSLELAKRAWGGRQNMDLEIDRSNRR